ncbi:hypothetical protein CEXT_478881 [Caerostris extrusa]|uniref:Uncharacterized protein n=1 Tax=Caerostris extrusa TaxID=172846 RepID=A0AAV4TYR7_CAEEX|nr:hypothetical protein CEXT_478881 [Caerostris extrusa]
MDGTRNNSVTCNNGLGVEEKKKKKKTDNAPRPHAVFTQSPFKSFSVPSTFISLLTTPRLAVNCLINGAKKEESIVGFNTIRTPPNFASPSQARTFNGKVNTVDIPPDIEENTNDHLCQCPNDG